MLLHAFLVPNKLHFIHLSQPQIASQRLHITLQTFDRLFEASHNTLKCNCPIVYPRIDTEDDLGETALQIAITRGATSYVSLLLGCSPKVDSPRRKFNWTSKDMLLPGLMPWERALHFAIRSSQLELFKVLLAAKANVELLNSDGKSPLGLAIHNENRDATTALLAHGADYTITCTVDKDLSLLEEAVQIFSPTILDDLVASRSYLDLSTSGAGIFVLQQAQMRSRWEAIQKVVQQGTRKERIGRILDEEGILYYALISSSPEMVESLLHNGANVDKKSSFDRLKKQQA